MPPDGTRDYWGEREMRYILPAIAMLAVPVSAQGQESAWGYFQGEDGSAGAGVQNEKGAQLLIKCDKPGKGEVHVAIFTQSKLTPPYDSFTRRDITLRFDDGSPDRVQWRYYPQTAMAVDAPGDPALGRFLPELVDASELTVDLDPVQASPVRESFNVAGAKEAVTKVYELCEDELPIE